MLLTHANSCLFPYTTLFRSPPAIMLSTSITDVLCHGDATGAVNLTVSGGTPGYTYLWSNGATTTNLSSVVANTYRVTVTDDNNSTRMNTSKETQPTAIVLYS